MEKYATRGSDAITPRIILNAELLLDTRHRRRQGQREWESVELSLRQSSHDVRQGPLELAAQTAGLDQGSIRPVTDGEGFVASGAHLIPQAHFSLLVRPWSRLLACHRRDLADLELPQYTNEVRRASVATEYRLAGLVLTRPA